jgi:hypothetical protein
MTFSVWRSAFGVWRLRPASVAGLEGLKRIRHAMHAKMRPERSPNAERQTPNAECS